LEHSSFGTYPSRGELTSRITRLQELLRQDRQDGALFFQNADLIYLCGSTQAETVFIPLEGEPLVLARPPLNRIRNETPLIELDEMPSRPDLLNRLEKHTRKKITRLGLEFDVLPVAFYQRLREKTFPKIDLTDASPLLRRVRTIKTDFEIEQMDIAARDLDSVFSRVPDYLAPGVTELELESQLIAMLRANGHQGLIRGRNLNMELFFGHVLSGENGLVQAKVDSPTGGAGVGPGFGQGAGVKRISAGELVSIDLVGSHGGYLVDQTRLFGLGDLPETVHDTYGRLRELVDRLNEFIRPGIECGQVYARAFTLAREMNLDEGFMGLADDRCLFIGHGVGLELDEWPVLGRGVKMILEPGMVFALEPRIFMPGVGVAGLEDTYVLREAGPEPITVSNREIIMARA